MQINRVALDLAKQVIQVHAVDRSGHRVLGKALKRAQVLPFFRELAPCEIGMEACSAAITGDDSCRPWGIGYGCCRLSM
jgi:transposase